MGRAWLVGHRAIRGAAVLAALTIGTVVFADLLLESVLASSPFPVWGMYPPTAAVVAGTMCAHRLPEPNPRGRRMLLARSAWALLIMLSVAGSSALVAAAAGHAPVVQESLVLTAITVGASCAVGRACVGVGLIVDAAVATMGADSRFVGLEFWYTGLSTGGRVAIVGGAGACLLAYAALGAREESAEERADG